MSTSNRKPVRKRAKKAKISPELHAQNKQAALTAAQQLNADVVAAVEDLDEVIDGLAVKHGKSVEVIQELFHLGGHVLKSRRAVGINNAHAHCEARCETTCMCGTSCYYFNILTACIIGADDPTKDGIKAIILAAKELGGYQGLSPAQQQMLIDQLVVSREEDDTGIVRRPMAQLQDARVVMERVRREVPYFQCHLVHPLLIHIPSLLTSTQEMALSSLLSV